MIVFATSDKGGTGRSVTMSNIAYRCALRGQDVCYLDFDFGSPTVGSIFQINDVARGAKSGGGLHSYFHGSISDPARRDVWRDTDRSELNDRPPGAGRLVLHPGDASGGEFSRLPEDVQRCTKLFQKIEEQFDLCVVDLSAGRSYATDLVLETLSPQNLGGVEWRWLIFHRWTRQHIIAASGLVYERHGLLDSGQARGHDKAALNGSIRFVRTAVVDPNSDQFSGLRPAQVAWLRNCDRELRELAGRNRLGRTNTLGSIPLDPVLQWREQLILDEDVFAPQVANQSTVAAFELLVDKLFDPLSWVSL